MRRSLSGKIGIILILSLLLGCFYQPMALAAGVSPFSDIDDSHWAFKSVIKLQCRGVISGYSDGQYKPNNIISQVEAVILAVRNLDVDDEVAAMSTATPLPFAVPEWAANNNKKELLYALQVGLIDQASGDFNATQAATRSWFTKLMVKMCKLDSQAASYAAMPTTFTDNASIPAAHLGAVNIAIKKGLISGYSDNTFLPDKYVTRVEAASILDRCEPFLTLDSIRVATITNVMGSMLTVQSSAGTQNVLLSSSTWAFDEKGKFMSASNFKIGENVKYISGNTNVIYAEKTTDAVVIVNNNSGNTTGTTQQPTVSTVPSVTTSPNSQTASSSLSATVLYVSENDGLIVARKSDGSILTGTVTDNTRITDSMGMPLALSSIPVDGEILIVTTAGGMVSSVQLKSSTASGSVIKQGTIYRIVPEQKLFMLQSAEGKMETYQYTALLHVTIPGVNVATIGDLKIGDRVKLTIEDGVMQHVEWLESPESDYITGEIVMLPDDTDMMIVTVNGAKEIYTVSNKAVVTIPGNTAATIRSVRIGDTIRFKVSEGAIVKIDVMNRLVGSDLDGVVTAIDTRENVLVLETSAGVTYSYKIKDNVRILVDADEATMDDIEVGNTVSITLFNDEINTITVLSGIEGMVMSVDTTRMLLMLTESHTGKNVTYAVEVDPEVYIEGVSRASLANVRSGDIVRVDVDDDVVTEIHVQRTLSYTVSSVKESSSRITVTTDSGSSRTLFVKSNVDLVIPNVVYPSIYDFEEGQQVDVTFMGDTMEKIEVVPVITGQVTAVDAAAGSFVVTTYEGVSQSFNFPAGGTIINESTHGSQSESYSLNSLKVNDRVMVQANTTGKMTIYRLDRIEGSFITVLSDTEQVRVIAKPAIINRTYGFVGKVYLHQGSQLLTWSNLFLNDNVVLYLHQSQVYEIEKL